MLLKWLNGHWKGLMVIPMLILIAALGFLGYRVIRDGSLIDRDIELKGGKLLTVEVETGLSVDNIQKQIPETRVRMTQGVRNLLLVEMGEDVDENMILGNIKDVNIIGEPAVRHVGPILGEVFFQQAQIALIIAFIFMGFVVFILFRTIMPSLAVIFAAVTDMVVTFSFMSFMGMELSLTSMAALLMLIGYSIDTDILLTSRVLRRKEGKIEERIRGAVKTGLTMSCTTLAALISLYLVSGTPILEEIAMVLIIGLVVDIPTTYLTNLGILRWYLSKQPAT